MPSGRGRRTTRDSKVVALHVNNWICNITTTPLSSTVSSSTIACPSGIPGLIVATVTGWLLAATLFVISLYFFKCLRQSSTIAKPTEH
ncbi:hypothetical protein MAR_019904, partial [Mya arenaria]